MRIAFIHEIWEAGAASCVHDLERELSHRHEVTFVPREGFDTAESILDELQSFRPDVVHCHSFYSNLAYSLLPRVSRRYPTCFTVHDPRPIGTLNIRCPLLPGRWRKLVANPYLKQRLEKRFGHMRYARDLRVVSPSEWLRGRVKQQEFGRFKTKTIPWRSPVGARQEEKYAR